jgi:N-acetylneuraminate synthase
MIHEGNKIFENLIVLEMTNNHLGQLNRAKDIVNQHSKIVKLHGVRAAIKLQFRNVDTFVHKHFKNRKDIRYIARAVETEMTDSDYEQLIKYIKKSGCIPISTPFDEYSVDMCVKFNLPIIKIASADSNDWILINKISETKKPVIASLGGLPLKDIDDLVTFFENRNIPLALNHCIATYPSQPNELELNQIDFLKKRYPNHVIGLSTHESGDSVNSMLISYAKGARTWEKHIDIITDGLQISEYSATPHQIDKWFSAYHLVREMCGMIGDDRYIPTEKELSWLDNYTRGVYLNKDMKKGSKITRNDIYLAIPILKGQISCRELILNDDLEFTLLQDCKKDSAVTIDNINSMYANNEMIRNRGIE